MSCITLRNKNILQRKEEKYEFTEKKNCIKTYIEKEYLRISADNLIN